MKEIMIVFAIPIVGIILTVVEKARKNTPKDCDKYKKMLIAEIILRVAFSAIILYIFYSFAYDLSHFADHL